MRVEVFNYNSIEELLSNTYVLINDNKCVVIDPSNGNDGIINYINNNHLSLCGVLLTHAHFDHMRGVDKLIKAFSCPLYIHEDDVNGLTDSKLNCSSFYNKKIAVNSVPTLLKDKEHINLGGIEILAIHTPYHTVGSTCYYVKDLNALFSGDSLFKNSVGRSDLPSSCPRAMVTSLDKLKALPDATKVYPGHGWSTSIGDEKKYNSFLK